MQHAEIQGQSKFDNSINVNIDGKLLTFHLLTTIIKQSLENLKI